MFGRAQVFVVPFVLADMGDAVRRGGERRLSARCRQQVRRERVGAVRGLLHCQLHGEPGRVHDRQGGLRQDRRHQRLGRAYTRTAIKYNDKSVLLFSLLRRL